MTAIRLDFTKGINDIAVAVPSQSRRIDFIVNIN